MTYYGSQELAASFRTVRNNTITIAEEIPEDKYELRAAPECRSVAQTLVHMAISRGWRNRSISWRRAPTLDGFDFMAFFGGMLAEEQKPRTKSEIIELLKTEGEKIASLLEGCSEEFLSETMKYPGGHDAAHEVPL